MSYLRGVWVSVLALALVIATAQPAPAAEGPPRLSVEPADVSAFPDIATPLIVRGGNGLSVPGLTARDFEVLEDGQTVSGVRLDERTSTEQQAATVILGIDTSGSMEGEPLERAVSALTGFVDALGPNDQVAAVSFASEGRTCLFDPGPGLTSNKQAVRDHIASARAIGDTPFFDATLAAVQLAQSAPESRRRMVVMLTDGEDTCSQAKPETVVLAAVRHGIALHIIGLGPNLQTDALRQLAQLTGGEYIVAESADRLAEIYEGLGRQLRTQYTLHYRSSLLADRKEHVLRIRVRTEAGEAASDARFTTPVVAPVPRLSILDGQRIDVPTRVEVTISGPLKLASAEFDLGGKIRQTVSESPFTFTIDPAGMANGPQPLRVRITDTSGGEATTQSTVDIVSGSIIGNVPYWAVFGAVLALPILAVIFSTEFTRRSKRLACPRCRRRFQPGWTHCPYCTQPAPAGPGGRVATMAPAGPAMAGPMNAAHAAEGGTLVAAGRGAGHFGAVAEPPGSTSGDWQPGLYDDPPTNPGMMPGFSGSGFQNGRAPAFGHDRPTGEARTMGMGGRLLIENGPQRGRQIALTSGVTTIGRGDENDIALQDGQASRFHARVQAQPDGYFVEDLRTTNGTLVNGRPVSRHRLADGDRVVVGDTELVYRAGR